MIYAETKTRFEELMNFLSQTTKGGAASQFIRLIDPRLRSRYSYVLPWLDKVNSNSAEQINSDLLEIREYANFKLIILL